MSLMRSLYAQFARLRGRLGAMVGWILAARPSNRRRARWTLSLLDARPGDRLLDVGCGPGVALGMALTSTPMLSVVGLDHSDTVLKQARRRLARWRRAGRVDLLHATLGDSQLESRSFDRICSMNVIQFLPDRTKALAALKTLLKPGGCLATTYQPRGASPDRKAAVDMADALSRALRQLGFINVRVEWLELRPAPAVCVLGDLPTLGEGSSSPAV